MSLWLQKNRKRQMIDLSRFKAYPYFIDALTQYVKLKIPKVVPVSWESYSMFLDLLDEESDADFVNDVAAAIRAGEDVPPLFRDDDEVFDGRHRAWAARQLGIRKAPVVDISRYWRR